MKNGSVLKSVLIFPILLCCLLFATPAFALDTVYLVRHAEKIEPWPADRDLDSFRPLSPTGITRAEALAERLKDAGIVAAYTSRTTRTLATAMPLVNRAHISVKADDATTKPDEMMPFLEHLVHDHANDRAVLIVGHSNTIPELLVKLGATSDCFERIGIKKTEGLEIEGYDGLWKIDLKKQGCAAIARE